MIDVDNRTKSAKSISLSNAQFCCCLWYAAHNNSIDQWQTEKSNSSNFPWFCTTGAPLTSINFLRSPSSNFPSVLCCDLPFFLLHFLSSAPRPVEQIANVWSHRVRRTNINSSRLGLTETAVSPRCRRDTLKCSPQTGERGGGGGGRGGGQP